MPYLDEVNQKLQAEKACYAQTQVGKSINQDCCGTSASQGMTATRERTRSEQLNADADAHRHQASRFQRAANFFAAHPEFEEFMKLREEGAIYF